MDCAALEQRAAKGDIGCVVATLGTTGTGSIDPLPEILRLRDRFGFRVHADAAYGGYFTLADNLTTAARAAFDSVTQADSIVIDPHKHGLQPYGCGCVLFRDPAVGALYKHDSPYTYFSSKDLHLGEISLECSRPGAAAVALWATQRLLPLEAERRVRSRAIVIARGRSRTGAPLVRIPQVDCAVPTGTGYRRLGAARAHRQPGVSALAADLRSRRKKQPSSRIDPATRELLQPEGSRPGPGSHPLPSLSPDETRTRRLDRRNHDPPRLGPLRDHGNMTIV